MVCYQYTTSSIEREYIDIYIILGYNVFYVVATPVRHETAFQGVFRVPRSFPRRPRALRCPPRRPGRDLHPQAPPPDRQRAQPGDPDGRPVRRLHHRQRAGPLHPLRVGDSLHLDLLHGLPVHDRRPLPDGVRAGVQAEGSGAGALRPGSGRPGAGVLHRPLGRSAH